MGTLPNTDDVDERGTYEPIPAGTYKGIIAQTEIVTTEKGATQLKIEFEIIEGEYTERKVFERATLRHDNPKAEEIGLRLLKQLKIAVGKPQSEHEEDLWGVPVMAKINVRPGNDQYPDPQNRIREFKPVGDAPARTAAPARGAATATMPPGEGPKRGGWRK